MIARIIAEPRPAPVLTALSTVGSRIETASEVRLTYALNRPLP